MYYTGFADEASDDLDLQIAATKALGWKNMEARRIFGSNIAFMTDSEFAVLEEKLQTAGVSVNCFGSGIANWASPIFESPERSYEEMRRAVPRLQRLGCRMLRIMSFSIPQDWKARAWELEDEVIKRVRVIVSMAEDAGLLCVHENCMNWGGLSWQHTLRLLERIPSPALKLVFDTGNPVFNDDYSGVDPIGKQSSWDFYRNVREHIAYIHIKDGVFFNDKQIFTFAGDGEGDTVHILTDLLKRGYDGGISIEPHMSTVFHELNATAEAQEELRYQNYIEYGRKIETMIASIRTRLSLC